MKTILKYIVVSTIGLFLSTSSLFAGTATVDLSIALNISESVVEAGQPYTNNITITNENPLINANVNASGAKITYQLLPNSTYNSYTGSGWSCIHDSLAVVCTYNTTLNNTHTSNSLVLKINAPNVVTTLDVNSTVNLSGTTDPVSGNDIAYASIQTGKSNLTATKTASSDTLAYDEAFSYTISVSNPDAGTKTLRARDVNITDTLPPGFQLTSINTTGGLVCNESPTNTLTCNPIDFDVNATKTVTIGAIASPSSTNLTNTANITAASSDYNAPLSPSKTVVVQLADIGITQSITSGVIAATNKVAVDSNVVYRYTVKNHGATTAKDVNISSIIPAGATLVSTSGAWTCTTATPIGNTASPLKCSLSTTDLAGGDSSSLDVTLKMPSSVATLTSNATAYTSSAEENNNPNSTPTLTTTVVGADLDIAKTQSSPSANIGENHEYTITVTNNGLVAADGVYVVDTLDLDQNMTYISDTSGGKCSLNGTIKTLTCNIGTIAAGDNYPFNVTVKMPTDSSTAVTNKVDVNTSTGQDNLANLTDSIDTPLTRANLSITKQRSQHYVGLGKTFYYTITVNNSNTATAYNPTITDILPAGVSITSVSNNSDNWNCDVPASGGSTFTCTLPTGIFPNPSSMLRFNAVASTTITGSQKNTAKIGHSLKSQDDSNSEWIVIKEVALDITKEASPTAIVGGLIDYNISVDNTSISDANQTTITDDISAFNGTYILDATSLPTGDWDCTSSTATKLTCVKNTLLLAGDNDTINFKVKVPLDAPLGTVKNKAKVDTSTVSNTPKTSNETSTTIKGASLVLSQTGDADGVANEQILFTVEVLNDGTATAKDVNVTIDLNTNSAANFTNISVDCGSGSNSTSEPFTCTLNDIASGTSKNIIITATAPNYDSVYSDKNITNSAQAFTSTPQETTNTDHITWDTPISGADLFVQKTPSSPEVAVGETVTYTIALRNQGLADATNITLTDSVLGATPLILSNLTARAGWSCPTSSSSGFTCDYNSTLAKDTNTTTITIDATAPMNATLNTELKNQVDVNNSTAEVDISTTNKSVSPVTVRGADVNITKTVDKPIVTLGEQVVFTINVANNDLANAQDVNVTDPLPTGFTYISSTCTNKTVNGLNFLCELGTIASGASTSFTITANAPSTDGTFTNTATTLTSTPESNTNNNEDNATVTVQGADLRITKRDSADPVSVNSLYSYTIRLENIGESSAFGADINDTISGKGWTYVSMGSPAAGWTCSEDGTKINCHTNSEIFKGYNQDIIIFQVRAPSTIGYVYNTAVVDTNTSEADDITNNQNNTDTESTLVMEINLQARKLVNGAVSGINLWNANPTYVGIGDDINYTLQVRNEVISNVDGNTTVNIPITDANITDILPSNITNIAVVANSPRFTCNTATPSAGDTLTCTLDSNDPLLTSNGWVTVATITAKATTDFFDVSTNTPRDATHNWITNQYQALTTLGDNKPADNAPSGGFLVANTLIRAANMSIDKSGPATIGAGQSFIYTLDIKNSPKINDTNPFYNTPSTNAQTVTVTDRVPLGTTLNSASGNGWNCSGSTATVVKCTHNTDIAPGAVANSIDINVTAPNAITTLVNDANVTTVTSELTRLLPDNNDSVSTNVLGTNINVTKTGTTEAGMGDELTYTISVQNDSSTVPAKNVKIVDVLHAGVTLDANWSRDVTSDWSCVYNSTPPDRNISCDYIAGDLQPGASNKKSLTLYLKAPTYTGEIVNTAIATTTTAGDNNDTAQATTLISGANIDFDTVPFSQSPNPVGAYMPIDYNITVINKGYSEATDVNLTMQFPTGFSQEFNVTSSGGNGWGCTFDAGNVKLTCILGTLAPNDTTSTVQISALAPNANEEVSYDIRVSAKDSENNVTSAVLSPAPTTIVKGADLKIKKYAKDPDPLSYGIYDDNNITVGVNKFVDFNISVSNEAIGLAKNIVISDTFDARFSDLNITNSNGWNCTNADPLITCSLDTLAPNTTAPYVILSAKTTSILSAGPIPNSADVNTTTLSDNTYGPDGVRIDLEGATLSATLTPSKSKVAIYGSFTYDLNITNTGKNDAVDVNITDILNSDFNLTGFSWTSATNPWSCNDNNGTIECNQPLIIAYGGSTVLSLEVQGLYNKIGVYQNPIDINSSSLKNSLTVQSIPDVQVVGADVVVDINATPSEVLEDRNVTYVINVKDINISTAENIGLKQTFSQPINALYIDDNGTANCNIVDANQSVECTIASLDYMQDKNITIIATMPFTSNIIDPLTSTVDVNTTTPQEDTTNDTNSVDVKVMPIKPIANYMFDECKWNGSSNEVIDSISGKNGRGLNGADTKNHRLVKDENGTGFSPIWRVGVFDGNDDYVELSSLQHLNNSRTITAWIKTNDNTKSGQRIFIDDAGGSNGYALSLGDQGTGQVRFFIRGLSNVSLDSGNVIQNDKWYFVAGVFNQNTMNKDLYIYDTNGTLLNHTSQNVSGTAGISNATPKIGPNFDGNIDEVAIYDIALDTRAVGDIYNFEKNHKNYDGSERTQAYCGMNLEVLKTVSPTGNVGAETNLTYTIKVTNLAAEPLTEGFTLTDNLPAEVEYVSDGHSSNVNCADTQNLSCTFPNTLPLDINQFETFTINVKTKNLDKVDTTNTASVTSVQTDTDTSNNSSSVTNRIIGTDLKITKIATPMLPTPNVPFIYTVRVENISTLADARDIVMKDKFDSRLTYKSISPSTNEDNITISCAEPNSNNVISCDIPKLSQGNYAEFNVTMKSPTVEVNLFNEANVTSITKDTYLPNNEANITIDTNTTVSNINIDELHEKYFHKDASVNKYGNIATIGNTMLVAEGNTTGIRLNEINSTKQNSSSATLDVINTPNTSDDNITIEYAGLFWGGHIHGHDINETGNDIPFNEITFTTPDGVSHPISADKNDTNIDSNASNRVGYYHFKKGDENNDTSQIGNYRIFYGAKADITDIIKNQNANGNLEGSYTVSNMQVSDGIDSYDWAPTEGANWERFRDYGYFGGWSMVVIYSINHRYHREVKFKNLSSFSGFRVMTPKTPGNPVVLDTTIDGFITPLHGNIDSSLYNFMQGGDKELSLESMTVTNKSNTPHAVIEDLNNTNNIFNDTITLKQSDRTTPIIKLPNETYNVGTDIDQYNLNSEYDINGSCTNTGGRPCYLSNSQGQTTVTTSVSQSNTIQDGEYPSEQAFAQMLSMETQIFAPDFIDSYKECFKLIDPAVPQSGWVSCSEPLPLLRRGDTIKYRITAINTGDDYANDVYITDVLPPEVTLEDNSSIVSNIMPFNDPDANKTCSSSQYNYDETVRDSCKVWLQDQVDGNITQPYIIPDTMIDHSFTDINISGSKDTIVFSFPTFAKNHVAWVEFNTTVNSLAKLGKEIENGISITFTNPTLDNFGYSDSKQTQISEKVKSGEINFNWDNIQILVKDKGRDTVGAKVVNEPFDLNVTLSGINSLDTDVNSTIRINSLNIIDEYNTLTKDIYSTITDANNSLGDINSIHWFTSGTTYDRASQELGFDLNISIHDGNYTASRRYPQDFNATAPYAGDVFTTRPASFNVSLAGGTTSGDYTIVNAGQPNLSMNLTAPDFNGVTSLNYNADLSQGAGLSIGLDSNFSTNLACINQADLNITDANFINGSTTISTVNYDEVGVVKVILKDSNWTARDSAVGDCNVTSIGDNNSSDADGLISCSVDANSTSIVFKPDHFSFINTAINDHNNFTYMVENPISDPMFATITTTVESRNADDNKTDFFSNTCFANDVNLSVAYNATSKDLSTISLSIANDNNLTDITTDTNVNATDSILSQAYKSDFATGSSTVTLRVAVDRNQTTPQQPLKIEAQDINGSIDSYLGIANADVSGSNSTNDINTSTNDLHFYYGRVHAPDYRFAGASGNARVYYEVYCSDCNQTDRTTYTIGGSESSDSIDWYINTLHTQVIDGNVSLYNSLNDVKFGASQTVTAQSTGVTNGVETILVTAPSLPYKDKVEMNSTTWTTFNPTSFILEFQDEQKDWAGQGQLGHIIDTNVSKRSNRRLDW